MLRRYGWLLPLALCAALYAPTLTNGFLADDCTYLVSLGRTAGTQSKQLVAELARLPARPPPAARAFRRGSPRPGSRR